MITRRHLVAMGAVAAALPFTAVRVWAATSLDLPGGRIDTLSDGNLVLPGDFILGGMPQEEMKEIVSRYGLPTDQLTPPCNVTLFRDGTNTVLFDVGSGPDFQPSAGKLAEAFDTIGITVEDVTHVVFTHGHPDHLWGLLDEFDEPLFPNASLHMGKAEFDYWMDPATVESIGEARASFAAGAKRRLEAVADAMALFGNGDEIVPGIAARATFGHTPGHMAFELGSGADAVMVVGDAIGNHHVAFERLDWPSGSDQDPAAAAATRVALMDRLASENLRLIGYHLPEGGIGRAERKDGAYRFVAET